MKNSLIAGFEKRVLKKDREHPRFRPGDTIRVHYKIEEGTKEGGKDAEKKFRIQQFEGICTRYKKGFVEGSFTVRKMAANSVGVERTFPNCSPFVDKVEVIAAGVVRRARLFYLRDLRGKAARIKTRQFTQGPAATVMLTNGEGAKA
jgi:large subunit ribosomal protein L19